MKHFYSICIIAICCICCQNGKSSREGVFAPALQNKLNDFFASADTIFQDDEDYRLLYSISFYQEDEKDFVHLNTDYFYHKERVKGYVFVNNRLVVYEGHFTGKEQNLIDTSKLIHFIDTIPGYRSYESCDIDYEVIRQEYQIYSRDSLVLTYFGF